MCGIVGYAGHGDAKTFLLRALKDLEYRGYDSAGIAALAGDGITIIKRAGTVSRLEETVNGQFGSTTAGIAHTRWATHGKPNDINAHPHISYDSKVAIVHNGIIENHIELRRRLTADGIEFRSDTDSEAIAHLIAQFMEGGDSLLAAIERVGTQLNGLSVIVAMSVREPGEIVGTRIGYAGSLMLGETHDARILASSSAAMPADVTQVIHIDHCEAVRINNREAEIISMVGSPVHKVSMPLLLNNRLTDIGEHPHFMNKEISEQAAAVQGAIRGRVDFSTLSIDIPEMRQLPWDFRRVILAGMGTSYFAAMSGARKIESFAGIPASVEYAGELADREPMLDENDLLIAVTQSGETYDTLVAIEAARRRGSTVTVVTANPHGEAARIADIAIDIGSGIEIAVPSTKTFINSMLVLYMMALQLGSNSRHIRTSGLERHIESIISLPRAINRTLGQEDAVKTLVRERFADVSNMLILGRGDLFPVALEGALKMKETAYMHAEGCSASEMKHGVNALIEPSTPTIALIPKNDVLRNKMLASIYEVQSRGGQVIAVTHNSDIEIQALADAWLTVPTDEQDHSPFVMTIPLQQLAYHTAVARGYNPDRPRNLAKTVTVA